MPKHELVKMDTGGLDYYIRKKLDTQYLRDMIQMGDRVEQVEKLKDEKARTTNFSKREKVAYVDTNDNDQEFDLDLDVVEESEVNLAELKHVPPLRM